MATSNQFRLDFSSIQSRFCRRFDLSAKPRFLSTLLTAAPAMLAARSHPLLWTFTKAASSKARTFVNLRDAGDPVQGR